MHSILLVDRDLVYAKRLADRLGQLMDGNFLVKEPDHPTLSMDIEALAGGGVLVLADPARIVSLQQDGLNLPADCWIPWYETRQGQPAGTQGLYRLMPASQMAQALAERAARLSLLSQGRGDQTEKGHRNPLRLTVALDLGWDGHRDFVRNWLDQQILQGQDVFYLPLMPNYRMTLIQAPGSGPNLTHLLLRLANGDALTPSELGTYLERHTRGYWQFRPADRSDDLMLADPAWLRSIIILIKEKIRSLVVEDFSDRVRGQTTVLVDCQGLSFSRIAPMAVLADQLAVYLGLASDWASQCAQRELGELLARLPATCQILEMKPVQSPDVKKHRSLPSSRTERILS